MTATTTWIRERPTNLIASYARFRLAQPTKLGQGDAEGDARRICTWADKELRYLRQWQNDDDDTSEIERQDMVEVMTELRTLRPGQLDLAIWAYEAIVKHLVWALPLGESVTEELAVLPVFLGYYIGDHGWSLRDGRWSSCA